MTNILLNPKSFHQRSKYNIAHLILFTIFTLADSRGSSVIYTKVNLHILDIEVPALVRLSSGITFPIRKWRSNQERGCIDRFSKKKQKNRKLIFNYWAIVNWNIHQLVVTVMHYNTALNVALILKEIVSFYF